MGLHLHLSVSVSYIGKAKSFSMELYFKFIENRPTYVESIMGYWVYMVWLEFLSDYLNIHGIQYLIYF